jgi:type VI secretion system protein
VGGYGLPDLTEIYKNLPASVHDLRAQVENTLLKFEPRLRSVGIEISDNADPGLLVSFTMVCHLRKSGLVRFGTFFEPPRRMRVERLSNPAQDR